MVSQGVILAPDPSAPQEQRLAHLLGSGDGIDAAIVPGRK